MIIHGYFGAILGGPRPLMMELMEPMVPASFSDRFLPDFNSQPTETRSVLPLSYLERRIRLRELRPVGTKWVRWGFRFSRVYRYSRFFLISADQTKTMQVEVL